MKRVGENQAYQILDDILREIAVPTEENLGKGLVSK